MFPFIRKKSSEGILNFSAKPECTTDPECPDHLACIEEKCKNPCFTSNCGVNAECRAIKHRATCICNPGFVGDPYRICEERKTYLHTILWNQIIMLKILNLYNFPAFMLIFYSVLLFGTLECRGQTDV